MALSTTARNVISGAAMEVFKTPTLDVNSLDDALEDLVNHPNHYKSEGVGSIECIDAIQAALTEEEFIGFCKGNNIKYTWRSNRKQDVRMNIEKARWYLNKVLDII
tara:strand:+ start:833 stop:1150 length:318 start_codon:yes stop_codon:yes gene_type:complete